MFCRHRFLDTGEASEQTVELVGLWAAREREAAEGGGAAPNAADPVAADFDRVCREFRTEEGRLLALESLAAHRRARVADKEAEAAKERARAADREAEAARRRADAALVAEKRTYELTCREKTTDGHRGLDEPTPRKELGGSGP